MVMEDLYGPRSLVGKRMENDGRSCPRLRMQGNLMLQHMKNMLAVSKRCEFLLFYLSDELDSPHVPRILSDLPRSFHPWVQIWRTCGINLSMRIEHLQQTLYLLS